MKAMPKKKKNDCLLSFQRKTMNLTITYMSAYTYRGYVSETEIIITKYKIAAGPNNTSVLLLRETYLKMSIFIEIIFVNLS